MKRLSFHIIATLALFLAWSGIASAQQRPFTRVDPNGQSVTIGLANMRAAGVQAWTDVRQFPSTSHSLQFSYITAPSAITVTFECSLDGSTVATTIGTSTSITGDTISTSSTTTCAYIRPKVSGLTGTFEAILTYSGGTAAAGGASNVTAVGSKSNNAVVPGATNLGVLPAIANVAAPTYTEGDQVLLSLDLGGALRVSGGGVAQGAATAGQSGTLTQEATTTNPPTYVNATSNPITGDIHGATRVVCQYADGTVCTQNDVVATTGGGAADGTAFTANTTAQQTLGAVYSTANLATTSGNEYALRSTQTRSLFTNLRNENGLELGTPDNPINVRTTPTNPTLTPSLPDQNAPGGNLMALIGPLGNQAGVDGDRLKVSGTLGDDPCAYRKKTDVAISQTASTTIITGQPALSIYICYERIVVGAAEITSELEGTGSACGTGTIVHSGSATAANGESFAANGGYSAGSGIASVISLAPGNNFCIAQSGSNRVSGKVSYVLAP